MTRSKTPLSPNGLALRRDGALFEPQTSHSVNFAVNRDSHIPAERWTAQGGFQGDWMPDSLYQQDPPKEALCHIVDFCATEPPTKGGGQRNHGNPGLARETPDPNHQMSGCLAASHEGSRRGMQSENRRTSVDLRDLPVTRSLLLISLGSIIERCRRSRLAGLSNSDHLVTVDQEQNILGLETETEHQRYKRP
ncbi:hypothetical protein CCUS01_10860 [Colletotrichum cuscutae]|uniref:Uncharacterized protein n=1 Tax=Colletotrichum cuscutae TaxID=1209917 RepID=A0AAI9UA22_9PEZI|nr:hypothetical protein CCUS01_10860 [Colletotrichum cuscutae]